MKTLDKLKDKNLLTIKDNMVLLSPIDMYSFTTYPLTNEMNIIAVTEDEYFGLLTQVSMFDPTLTRVVDFEEPIIIDMTRDDVKNGD